jgi:hypothetical protein
MGCSMEYLDSNRCCRSGKLHCIQIQTKGKLQHAQPCFRSYSFIVTLFNDE